MDELEIVVSSPFRSEPRPLDFGLHALCVAVVLTCFAHAEQTTLAVYGVDAEGTDAALADIRGYGRHLTDEGPDLLREVSDSVTAAAEALQVDLQSLDSTAG